MVLVRSIGVMAALLIAAACSDPPRDPIADAPLTRWRTTGTQSRILNLPDGRRLRLPTGKAACGWPPGDAPQWTICTLHWSRKTGRLIGYDVGYHPDRVSTSYYFEPASYPGLRNMARGNADQWAAEADSAIPPDPEGGSGPVRGRLAGDVGGRPYWVGCWRNSYDYPFPYGCSGAIDLGRDSVFLEFETRDPPGTAPYALDRRRIEAMMRFAIAVHASFEEPPSAPSPAR